MAPPSGTRFFSHSRWSIEEVSAVAARLVVRLLVAADAAVSVAIDDTRFHRRGPKVHAASWFHDGSAVGKAKTGYGNNWVILAIVVRLAFLERPVALPVGFALVRKNSDDSSRLVLARRLVEALSAALPGRTIHVVADSAYAGKALRGLPGSVTWTTRLRANASLYELAPPRTGRRGRPRLKGNKLPSLASLATTMTFAPTTATRYGTTRTISTAVLRRLWYGVFGPQQVQVIFVRDKSNSGYDIALVTTDLDATASQVIERYASRWSIEVAIEDAKQLGGVGRARLPSRKPPDACGCRGPELALRPLRVRVGTGSGVVLLACPRFGRWSRRGGPSSRSWRLSVAGRCYMLMPWRGGSGVGPGGEILVWGLGWAAWPGGRGGAGWVPSRWSR